MRAVQNALYFSGIQLFNAELSISYADNFVGMDGRFHYPRWAEPEHTFSFDVYGKYQVRFFDDLARRRCRNSFFILGSGWLCQNCGDYNPSGMLRCMKCGGFAEEKFIKPMSFPFEVCSLSSQTFYPDGDALTRIDLVGYGNECGDAIYSLAMGNQVHPSNGYNFDSGYYLCQYCGYAVREGYDCPGCGGKRMPYSELVKLNRKCVHCGTPTTGNLVCDGCGARIKGMTFKQAVKYGELERG